MQSLVEKVRKSDVQAEPFPHIAIKDALDESLCAQLMAEFPSVDTITGGKPSSSNERFSLKAANALDNPGVSPVWQEFIRYHTSPSFFAELLELFGEHVTDMYPGLANGKSLGDLQAGLRDVDTFETADVLMEAQPSVNTPVTGPPSSVRSGHVDSPYKLFAGLYYMRVPEDDSTGGNLELYRYKKGTPNVDGVYVDGRHSEVIQTVEYERNTLVLFLNSIWSLHGVTPRSTTQTPRYFTNLVAEVDQPLFDLAEYQPSFADKVMRAPAKVSQRLRSKVH